MAKTVPQRKQETATATEAKTETETKNAEAGAGDDSQLKGSSGHVALWPASVEIGRGYTATSDILKAVIAAAPGELHAAGRPDTRGPVHLSFRSKAARDAVTTTGITVGDTKLAVFATLDGGWAQRVHLDGLTVTATEAAIAAALTPAFGRVERVTQLEITDLPEGSGVFGPKATAWVHLDTFDAPYNVKIDGARVSTRLVPRATTSSPATPLVPKATTKTAAKPAVKPADKLAIKPVDKTAAKPATVPAAKLADKPAAKQDTEPTAKPVNKATTKTVTVPVTKPSAEPAAEPTTPTAANPGVSLAPATATVAGPTLTTTGTAANEISATAAAKSTEEPTAEATAAPPTEPPAAHSPYSSSNSPSWAHIVSRSLPPPVLLILTSPLQSMQTLLQSPSLRRHSADSKIAAQQTLTTGSRLRSASGATSA